MLACGHTFDLKRLIIYTLWVDKIVIGCIVCGDVCIVDYDHDRVG